MNEAFKNLGKHLYENQPTRGATLYLDEKLLSTGRAQCFPDHVRFYPTPPKKMCPFQRTPLSVTFADKSPTIFVQMSEELSQKQTEKVWHFYYLNP